MKLVKPKFEILEQTSGIDGVLKQIELAGRTCYKSESNITQDSAPKFVEMLINRKHTAMLEHGTIYLILSMTNRETYFKYCNQKYSKAVSTGEAEKETWKGVICTNYRVLLENNWLSDLQYIGEPNWEDTSYSNPSGETLQSIKRITVKFTTQIAITREANRHRVNSIAEQSTRYCSFDKNKFGNEITINLPSWVELPESTFDNNLVEKSPTDLYSIFGECDYHDYKGEYSQVIYEQETYNWEALDWWLWANKCCEVAYMKLIEKGWKAEQARTILPLDTNTELCHTATISQWEHFFKLRCDRAAHVDMRELAIPLEKEFKNRKWIH